MNGFAFSSGLGIFIYGTTIVRNFHDFTKKMIICKAFAFASQYVFLGNLKSEHILNTIRVAIQVYRYFVWYHSTVVREHLGVEMDSQSIDVSDPVSSEFYKNIWLKQASINTAVYEKVSNCSGFFSIIN